MSAAAVPRARWLLVSALGALLAGWAGLRYGFAFNDYDAEASGSVAQLLHGDVSGFLAAAPSYGGSLVIRSPVVVATGWLGGGTLAAYRALAIPGLAAVALLAAGLAAGARGRSWSVGACLLVIALAFVNPAMLQALQMGHAEELLGGALCVGAVVMARRGRWVLAAVALGLAVANKQWAVVAVFPVLLALADRRARAAALAAAVTALVMAPLALQGSTVTATATVATSAGGFAKPLDLWWFTGHVKTLPAGSGLPAGTREPPPWVSALARPSIVLAAALLGALWWRRRRHVADPLGLLALILLARCLLDPWSLPYYHLPFLLALLAWESGAARRLPWATIAATAVLEAIDLLHGHVGPDVLSGVYLAAAVPGAIALALAVYAPERARALADGRPRALGRAHPATA